VTLRRSGASVELVVRDGGEGIAADFLPHLFERFRQADSSSTRRHGGLGLGLFIVRELVQRHGGEIIAASEGLGRGATFTVRQPALIGSQAAAPRPSAPAVTAAPVEAVSLAGIKVLGVDDDPGAREVLADVLLACGATVTLAASVHEALRAFKLDRPDVLVSDIGMPELDGYSLVGRIRALEDPAARSTPAIALTAYASAEDRERALRAGFDRYLSKPLDTAQLSRLIVDLARERVTS
jgi:CheY-like chemotaxis protein